jgi:hypothetical protein
MCRVSRITCVGTVAAFQDSGTCDA